MADKYHFNADQRKQLAELLAEENNSLWSQVLFVISEGDAGHVGIVERVENGTVYTVEGNSGDACRQRDYPIGSSVIYGYGLPTYLFIFTKLTIGSIINIERWYRDE